MEAEFWQETGAHNDEELLISRYEELPDDAGRLDRTLNCDVNTYLPGDLLVKADRMSMAASLEARSPFLDYQLVEWAARLPESREMKGWHSNAGEPDRWRNMPNELPLANYSNPDHYLDLEELADVGLTPPTLPIFRQDFAAKLALARAAHPEQFPAIDPLKNKDHTRELIGFAPWAIAEYCGKLNPASRISRRTRSTAAPRRKSPTRRPTSSTSWA